MRGLLLDTQDIAFGVDLSHTVTLRVRHPVAENRSKALVLRTENGTAQHYGKGAAVEDIVSQHQAGGFASDELTADDEGLCQAVR